nr:hypothetical protein BACY1_21030 [Tenacibaculum mesophilum]
MGYKIKTVDGELKEYAFDIGGVLALRNFKAVTNGNRLIIESHEKANFTILDALVNEVEIDGIVYDDPTAAQEALQRLVFNPLAPVILPQEERDLIPKGIKTDALIELIAGEEHEYTLPPNSRLYALEIHGAAEIIIGTSTGKDDLGDYNSTEPSIWNLGLTIASSVFIKSNVNVTVEPIIFYK